MLLVVPFAFGACKKDEPNDKPDEPNYEVMAIGKWHSVKEAHYEVVNSVKGNVTTEEFDDDEWADLTLNSNHTFLFEIYDNYTSSTSA